MKKLFYFTFSAIMMISALSGCVPSGASSGEPDRTSDMQGYINDRLSNNLINANIERGEDWEQIVYDSPFQIGEFIETENKTVSWSDGEKTRTNITYTATFETYPYIEGSTVCIPMGAEFARQHLGFDDIMARNIASFGTTSVAYNMLIDREESLRHVLYSHNGNPKDGVLTEKFIGPGTVDLILVTQPSDDELSRAAEAGVELVISPICWEAFVFITHKDNPVSNLSVGQIQQIYTGEITNWSEVGGRDQEIVAYQREPNSGSQTTMEKQVMNGLPLIPATTHDVLDGMGLMLDVVGQEVSEYENTPYSIGYTFKYYIDNLYRNDNIKVISIDGIAPTDENIRSGSYPFTANYFAVYRSEDKAGIAGQFAEWILSDEGQRCIAQAGYIPLN